MTTIFVMGVCLSVCLCPEHSSVGFDPILIKIRVRGLYHDLVVFWRMGVLRPLWAEPRPKNVFLGGSRFQVTSSPRGFVESGRGFGIWLA